MENGKNGFTPADIEEQTGINPNTLRKYAAALENAGHVFMRTTGGHRVYQTEDVAILRQFVALLSQKGMTVEMAARIVVDKYRQAMPKPSKSVTVSENSFQDGQIEQYDERYAEIMQALAMLKEVPAMKEQLRRQEEQLQQQAQLLQRQDEKIDRIEANTSQFGVADLAKELHKIQKTEAAAAAEEARQIENEKRGLIAKLFSYFKKKA